MKKYIAKTNVSINIVLASGTNRHISFSALSGGGSVFYTDDPETIQAIERHYKYGKLFHIDPNVPEKHNKNSASKRGELISSSVASETEQELSCMNESSKTNGKSEDEDVDDGLTTIVVSDPDSAKSYLAEHFGLSRTKIKTIKAIKEAAAANGIIFEGI